MTDPAVNRAVEAGAERLFASFIVSASTRQPCRVLAGDVLAAALPHILEALADECEAVERWAMERLEALPEEAGWSDRAGAISDHSSALIIKGWLRERAEKARKAEGD